jgi:hypothetical protein
MRKDAIRQDLWRCRPIERGRSLDEHLRLEDAPTLSDLPPDCLGPNRRLRGQPRQLRLLVNHQQEHLVEQVQHLSLVARYSADEHSSALAACLS